MRAAPFLQALIGETSRLAHAVEVRPEWSASPRRRRRRRLPYIELLPAALLTADLSAIVLVTIGCHLMISTAHPEISGKLIHGMLLFWMLSIGVLHRAGQYSEQSVTYPLHGWRALTIAWAGACLSSIAIYALAGTGSVHFATLQLAAAPGWMALLLNRLLLIGLQARWRRTSDFERTVVLVGAGPQVRRFLDRNRSARQLPAIRVLGIFADRAAESGIVTIGGYPVLGASRDLPAFAEAVQPDEVVITDFGEGRDLRDVIETLSALPLTIRLFLDESIFGDRRRRVNYLHGLPLINLCEKPISGSAIFLKVVEDYLVAFVALVLLSPVILLVALAVKLTSPGPVLFRQKRYGFNREVIEVLKFRSMRQADCVSGSDRRLVQVRSSDLRVTAIGRFIRRTSLDELPQFINVLRGEMSVVGPRPHAIVHDDACSQVIDRYIARHRVKPGITGWAQVNGLRGPFNGIDHMRRRLEADLFYIDNWSIWFDFEIILRTVFSRTTHSNAI